MWQLSDETLAQCILPADKSEKLYFDRDLSGFGIRVRREANGRVKRKWFYQFRSRIDGKQRRVALGNVDKPGAVPVAKARQKATELSINVQLGGDPSATRKAAKKDRGRLLLPEALRYLDDRVNATVGKRAMRPSTYRAARRYFQQHWAALGQRPVASITEDHVKAELRRIIDGHGKQAARAAKANLSAFFVWAMKEGLCRTNPTINTHDIGRTTPRDRVLNDNEIRAIWTAAGDYDFGRIIRLLFFTGCRREEIGSLSWNEIDLATGTMTLPPARTKAGRTLQLTLPPQAIEIVRQCPRKEGRQFLFGLRGGAFSRWSWEKMAIDKRLAEAGHSLEPWSLHDIRRTMRTRLGHLGIAPHVAELVIGHSSHKTGVVGVYDRHDYGPEIKDALARWATVLSAIVNPPDRSNVTSLRSA